ncbi:fibronectin type III domain-containing protein [Spirosoma aerolatum]|uniref:fibronectin type III domain-containing protein n=1 Tax=Spirosoma aerolatum TaxID=1211326 RepID=UPI0009AE18DD|nr:fibronectin type III domain-containing protein [Spirosoma aerolatum]
MNVKFVNTIFCLLWVLTSKADAFTHFITREGDQLKDGNKVFRFIAVNTPNITGHYDGYKNTNPASGYSYDPMELSYEMEAHFKDMVQMGVTTIRTWGITVDDGSGEFEALVNGPRSYNETAFRRIDKMLELCNKYKIRVILCLVKENKIFGSTTSFSTLYGGGDYYDTPAVKEGFKDLLRVFVNRKNQFTGQVYKNDKAILAWEFGNEVPNNKGAWIAEMADYLKRIDPNHLIADPRRANGVDQLKEIITDVLAHNDKLDIVKTRQYPNYRNSVTELWNECKGKRPMIVDEFQRLEGLTDVLEQVYSTGTSGALLWSLMKPQYTGGLGSHALFHAYSWGGSRWPGFDSGDYFKERENLMLIRTYGYKIRGEQELSLPAPTDAPYLYPSVETNAVALKWRCSPGARYYVVERATSAKGPWQTISSDLDISYHLYFYPLFTDTSIVPGQSYYYRIKGKNESGISPASNTIGPLTPETSMVMDNLKDFSIAYSHTENLKISTETWPRLRQTEEDFFQAERVAGSRSGELVYRGERLKWIDVFAFSDKVDSIELLYSIDGDSWKPLPEGAIIKRHRPAYPSPISKEKDNPIDKYTYSVPVLPYRTIAVKIVTGNAQAANTYPWIARVHIGFNGALKTAK